MQMHVGQVRRITEVPMEDIVQEEKLHFRRKERAVDKKSYLPFSEREGLLMGGWPYRVYHMSLDWEILRLLQMQSQ